MAVISFTVQDRPAPQGSKRHVGNGIMIESSKNVKTWREAVKAAALEAKGMHEKVLAGSGTVARGLPVGLQITFWHRRPMSHYRKDGLTLRPNAPQFVATRPDASKLIRSTEDAITAAGLWYDDAQVVRLNVWQRYSKSGFEGAEIAVWEVKP